MGRAHEVRAASMAKTAAAKTKVYSRYGKEIYMAAKGGVPDPSMNVTLKRVIEKAKAAQVPADVIKRNIEKAKGVQLKPTLITDMRVSGQAELQSLLILCQTTQIVLWLKSEVLSTNHTVTWDRVAAYHITMITAVYCHLRVRKMKLLIFC